MGYDRIAYPFMFFKEIMDMWDIQICDYQVNLLGHEYPFLNCIEFSTRMQIFEKAIHSWKFCMHMLSSKKMGLNSFWKKLLELYITTRLENHTPSVKKNELCEQSSTSYW